jgi:DNA-binding response OmpR family regulator
MSDAPAQPHARLRTILLVDDDPAIVRALEYSLEKWGFDVLTAKDGPAALAVLERQQRVDLLLSDVMMPGGMSGIELARVSQARRASLAILLTTGYAYDVIERLGGGFEEFPMIAKPYSIKILVNRIKEILGLPDGPAS